MLVETSYKGLHVPDDVQIKNLHADCGMLALIYDRLLWLSKFSGNATTLKNC